MAAIIGIDILAPGTTRAAARTAVGMAARATPVAARGLGSLAAANPYLAGTALGFGALQTTPGQELLEAAAERGRQDRLRLERFVQDTLATAPLKAKRKKSQFNDAVSAGMKAIKASKFMGKKGTITNAKRAFSTVTKVASGLLKGRKAPKSGARRVAYGAMPKSLRQLKGRK